LRTPLRFLWKCLKALYTKFVARVRHFAGNHRFHSNSSGMDEDEEAFWAWVILEELFD